MIGQLQIPLFIPLGQKPPDTYCERDWVGPSGRSVRGGEKKEFLHLSGI